MRNDYSSMKPFEVRCKWWRPDSPSDTVPGTIGFDGKEIIVQMDNWIGPENPYTFPRVSLLHAETIDGIKVTVYAARVISFDQGVLLQTNTMAVGGHLERQADQKFTDAVVRVNGLDEWWRANRFEIENATDGSADIHFAAPSHIDLSVPERSVSITLGEEQSRRFEGRRFEIRYEPCLRFVSDKPQTIDWFHEIVNETRQLLSLFINQDAVLVGLCIKPNRSGDVLDRVDWYWNRWETEIQGIHISRTLLPYNVMNGQLQNVLKNWLLETEALRHARALLFSTQAHPGPILETRFLPIIQALEVYCRALGSEKYIPESNFRELKVKLLDIVPSDLDAGLKQKLRTSIGFANELSLNDRILQLLNSLEQNTRRFVCKDAKKFASRLKDSRNFYTHYGDSKGKELKGTALYWATEQASLLLKILMLKGCGVSESLIQEWLKQSGYHSQGMRIWAEIEKEL